jgi:hypothetical protein
MFAKSAKRFSLLVFWGCVLAILATGCGKAGPHLVKVQGKVTMGNKPLTTGTVIFHPDLPKGNNSKEEPRGSIDEDGNYYLLTRIDEGVTPGWYKVSVTAAHQLDPKNPYFTDWLIPQKYIDPKTSKLQFEVVENAAPGAYDIHLDAKESSPRQGKPKGSP